MNYSQLSSSAQRPSAIEHIVRPCLQSLLCGAKKFTRVFGALITTIQVGFLVQGSKKKMDALLSLSKYADTLKRLTQLVPPDQQHEVRYFMATDDKEAEKIMKSSFEDGEISLKYVACLLRKSSSSSWHFDQICWYPDFQFKWYRR